MHKFIYVTENTNFCEYVITNNIYTAVWRAKSEAVNPRAKLFFVSLFLCVSKDP